MGREDPKSPGELKRLHRAPKSRIWLLLVPAMGYLFIFFVYPLFRILLLTIYDPGLTMKHYQQIFSSPAYLAVLKNTMKISAEVTFLCLVLGYPLAVLMAMVRERVRNLIIIAVIVPYFMSYVVRSYAWLVLLGREGIVNGVLLSLGIIDSPIKMVYNTPCLLIGMVHILLPIMVLSLYAVLRGIDRNLLKVSESLGARRVQTFLRVYFPLSLPGVGAGCILVFIFAIGFYITPALLGGLKDTMLSVVIAMQVENLLNWGFGGALALLLLAVTLCLFLAFNRMVGLDRIWGGKSTQASGTMVMGRTLGLEPVRRFSLRVRGALLEGLENVILWILQIPSRLWVIAGGKGAVDRTARHGRAKRVDSWQVVFYVLCGFIIIYLLGPIAMIFPISFTSSLYLEFPPRSFSLQWYEELLKTPFWAESAWLSLRVACTTAVLSVILGTLAALALARGQFTGKNVCYTTILSPIIVPVIVTAVGLYYFFSTINLVGTFWGLVFGHTIGAIPVVTVLTASALKGFNITLEHAAMSLGAGRIRTFFRVTLPIIRPAIVIAAFFAFMYSFDEIVIAFFVGGLSAETLPKKLWEGVRLEIKPTLAAVSSLLIGFTIVMLLTIEVVRRRRQSSLKNNV